MRNLLLMIIWWVGSGVAAQDVTELFVARDVLSNLQAQSFQQAREFCGYIGYNVDGEMVVTDAVGGDKASCAAAFPRNVAVTASYHTHGDFNEEYFNEIPSVVDIEGDAEFYMNGYVATPGGRLWYVDTKAKVVRQICGIACLPQAKEFRAGNDGPIAETYTFDALRKKIE